MLNAIWTEVPTVLIIETLTDPGIGIRTGMFYIEVVKFGFGYILVVTVMEQTIPHMENIISAETGALEICGAVNSVQSIYVILGKYYIKLYNIE